LERRSSLAEAIESELRKDPEDIDGDFIDREIDRLYALEGRTPPKLSAAALDAAARTVRSRAAWRRRNRLVRREQKSRFTRRILRGALAACGAFIFLFSANYVTTMLTGSCLPSRAGIEFCCGTRYCICEAAASGEEEGPETHP
jgi:hypothetical protein